VVTHEREGLLVETKNTGALADGICRLLANPSLRASMRETGQAKALRYDWARVSGEVLEYYSDVLDRQAALPQVQSPRFARVRRMAGLLHGGP
jgi:glycosyltransferase involved in cell wall biosynthesis